MACNRSQTAAEPAAFLQRLETLYEKMDARYQQVAAQYGFVCTGCLDNCCRTRFYHHTHVEYGYLKKAFACLEKPLKQALITRAKWLQDTVSKDPSARPICPLNEEGKCLLYAARPMICRLHGIPHELHHPGRGVSFAPGCGEFDRQCKTGTYIAFDRTPLYMELAQIEHDLKAALGKSETLRITVAEMLIRS
jgi:Fe-S-cluster containining protein